MRPACRAGARKSSGIRAAREGGSGVLPETGLESCRAGQEREGAYFLSAMVLQNPFRAVFIREAIEKAHASGAHLVSHCFLNRPVETFALVLRVGHCVNRLATREYGVSQREGATEDSREGDGFSPPRHSGYTKAFSSRCFLVEPAPHFRGTRMTKNPKK